MSMTRRIEAGGAEIAYRLTRKAVKNLNLRVGPDGTVKVSIPYSVSFKTADEFVRKNAEFIFNAQANAREKTDPPIDRVYFLGSRLEITVIPCEKNAAALTENKLLLYIKENKYGTEAEKVQAVQDTLKQWQKEKGKELFPELIKKAYVRFIELGLNIPFPTLTVKSMKTRWGSCTSGKGKICLNAVLVEKPPVCIEYVICHELSHFLVQNHSASFYAVLSRVFPNHREVKRLLNTSSE